MRCKTYVMDKKSHSEEIHLTIDIWNKAFDLSAKSGNLLRFVVEENSLRVQLISPCFHNLLVFYQWNDNIARYPGGTSKMRHSCTYLQISENISIFLAVLYHLHIRHVESERNGHDRPGEAYWNCLSEVKHGNVCYVIPTK